LRTCEHHDASIDSKALTPTPSAACTSACTSEGENANDDAPDAGNRGEGEGAAAIDQGDPLAWLAAELGKLSPEDRQRLAALLIGRQGEGQEHART
jgi:hypothetical protein